MNPIDPEAAVECAATGHRWEMWRDRLSMEDLSYRYRHCEHCGQAQTDPPFQQLGYLMHAARTVNAIEVEGWPT